LRKSAIAYRDYLILTIHFRIKLHINYYTPFYLPKPITQFEGYEDAQAVVTCT